MAIGNKPTFKKDGTVFGNMFRLLLALLVLSVVWFSFGFNWSHNHGHDLFEYGYVRDQYLGFHYSLAITFIPAVIIGCVLGSMVVLGPVLFFMNAINMNSRPKFYLGFLVSLAVMAGVSCLPSVAAYLTHKGNGVPLFEAPPPSITSTQPSQESHPDVQAEGRSMPFSTDGMDPAVVAGIRAQAPDVFLDGQAQREPPRNEETSEVCSH